MLIPHSRPWICEEDEAAVLAVLRGGMLAMGDVTRRFEAAIGSWVDAPYAIGVGSGSAAIVLSLQALGVKSGDEVILPTYVCPSVLECVLAVGATPVLCDVGQSWVVTTENVKGLVSSHTGAIIVPHMYGIFAEVEKFRDFGVPVIEDCAQAIGDRGQHPITGDIAVFSFHPTKCLTTGEGGMAVTQDVRLGDRMRKIRDGVAALPSARLFSPLPDTAAALGLSQLCRYSDGLRRRRQIADQYRHALGGAAFCGISQNVFDCSMHFRYPMHVQGGLSAYANAFLAQGIAVRKGGVNELLHRLMGIEDDRFPIAVKHFETTVSLPIYPSLSSKEATACAKAAQSILAPTLIPLGTQLNV